MGFNSVLVILNDELSEIERDTQFGKKVAEAIAEVYGEKEPQRMRGYSSAAVSSQHADYTQVVCVGGNLGSQLGIAFTRLHHEEEGKIKVLKDIADKFGYRLVKKSKKKGEK